MNDRIFVPDHRTRVHFGFLDSILGGFTNPKVVEMSLVWWAFPECTMKGDVQSLYKTMGGQEFCLARGYRCSLCNKVFFATDLNFSHAPCTEDEK